MTYAKKSFGQHFLTNESIAERIAESLQSFGPIGDLLEVGPGRGMLTKYLTGRSTRLHLVDADRDMIEILKKDERFTNSNILFADVLQVDLSALASGKPVYIIGNFPYNISSQIVFKMIDNRLLVPGMVGMFQKEMAERIAHEPGSREYGVISVLTQAYYEVDYLFTVKEGNFNPPPKVKSAVLRFSRKTNQVLGCDEVLFRKIVKSCFLQKRKMIRNSLKAWMPAEQLKDDYYDQRPEQMSVADYVLITNRVSEKEPKG